MIGWFSRTDSINPKEAFPIENLPVETYGGGNRDALRSFYSRPKALPQPPRIVTQSIQKEKEDFFRRILPILDGFDEIFEYAERSDVETDETLANWLKTLGTLYRRLLSALEKEGLIKIESLGKPLDLSLHEVIDTRIDPSVPENTVVEEVVRGYRFGQRMLRDAKVIVAKQ